MATTTITALTAVNPVNLTDEAVIPVDDSAASTKKATIAQIRTAINNAIQTIAGAVVAAGFYTPNAAASGNITLIERGTSPADSISLPGVVGVGGTINGKASLSASAQSTVSVANETAETLPNTATQALLNGAFSGMLLVSRVGASGTALFLVDSDGTAATLKINSVGGGTNFSNTAATAASVNIYYVGAVLTIQNLLGVTLNYRCLLLRTE
jgi:hypothetical protein